MISPRDCFITINHVNVNAATQHIALNKYDKYYRTEYNKTTMAKNFSCYPPR